MSMDELQIGAGTSKELTEADLGASKPVPIAQPKPTYTVQHPIVKACGHSIDMRHEPKHANCEHCWRALFEVGFNEQEMEKLHKLLMVAGSKGVATIYGKKFLKAFGAWMKERLLRQASPEVQAASGIEGAVLDIKQEANLGIR